jgi:hypothetical protein
MKNVLGEEAKWMEKEIRAWHIPQRVGEIGETKWIDVSKPRNVKFDP